MQQLVETPPLRSGVKLTNQLAFSHQVVEQTLGKAKQVMCCMQHICSLTLRQS